MILIDTSASVEFVDDTSSPVCAPVDAPIRAEVGTCQLVPIPDVEAGVRLSGI